MRLVLLLGLAIVAVMAIGAGSAAAISGVAGDGSAGIAQYPPGTTGLGTETLGEQGEVLGEEETGQGVQPDRQTEAGGVREVAGLDDGTPGGEGAPATDDGGLPFTGLALIALLLSGTALLVAGFVLRRRAGSPPA